MKLVGFKRGLRIGFGSLCIGINMIEISDLHRYKRTVFRSLTTGEIVLRF